MTIQSEKIVHLPPAQGDTLIPAKWVFWYLIPSRSGQSDWAEYLHPLHSFDSVDCFWRLFNSVEKLEKLLKGCRYYVFRNGVKPLWEDKSMRGGKAIIIEIPKNDLNNSEIEKQWTQIVVSAISEEFGPNVLGIEFTSRTDTWRIALWLSPDVQDILLIKEGLSAIFPLEIETAITDIGSTE